jgi:DnaK suppressor protein
MEPANLIDHKLRLHAKARELEQQLRMRGTISIEPSADPIDEVQSAADRELAIESLDLKSALLAQVRSALCRIDSGEYGRCEECDEPISPRRLEALPWATRCIRCQEIIEKQQVSLGDSSQTPPEEPRLSTAA